MSHLPENHPVRVSGISRVTVAEVPKGYRYTVHYADGGSEVVRAAATRRYDNAFFYDDKGGRNNAADGVLGGYFTWGKTPEIVGRKVTPHNRFRIESE